MFVVSVDYFSICNLDLVQQSVYIKPPEWKWSLKIALRCVIRRVSVCMFRFVWWQNAISPIWLCSHLMSLTSQIYLPRPRNHPLWNCLLLFGGWLKHVVVLLLFCAISTSHIKLCSDEISLSSPQNRMTTSRRLPKNPVNETQINRGLRGHVHLGWKTKLRFRRSQGFVVFVGEIDLFWY